jgi:hypothetical protein
MVAPLAEPAGSASPWLPNLCVGASMLSWSISMLIDSRKPARSCLPARLEFLPFARTCPRTQVSSNSAMTLSGRSGRLTCSVQMRVSTQRGADLANAVR